MNEEMLVRLWRWVHGLSNDAVDLKRPDHQTKRFAQMNAITFTAKERLDPSYVPYVSALIVLMIEIERKDRYGTSAVDDM